MKRQREFKKKEKSISIPRNPRNVLLPNIIAIIPGKKVRLFYGKVNYLTNDKLFEERPVISNKSKIIMFL